MRAAVFATALAVAAFVTPADAQSIYKYVRPDGHVVYSDKPVPGARLDEELAPAPEQDPAVADAARAKLQARIKALDQAAAERVKSLDQASKDLYSWSRKLEEAKKQLEAGREPRPGERTGTVFQGKSRTSEAYWARQMANEAAVAEAEARVEHARDRVEALR